MSAPLRLLAEDAADLEVLSAALQDALVQVRDLSFDARGRRFVAMLNRFRWARGGRSRPERVRAALAVEGVLSAQSHRLRRDAPDAVAAVLAVLFDPGPEPPGGTVRLVLAGGGEVRLEVEQLEARLLDVGVPWPAARRPRHEGG